MSAWSIPGMCVGEAYHWQNSHSIREMQRTAHQAPTGGDSQRRKEGGRGDFLGIARKSQEGEGMRHTANSRKAEGNREEEK